MTPVRRFLLRLLACVRSSRAEADLAREIAAHLQLLEDKFLADGLSPEEARFAARCAFGGVEQVKEHQRDTRSFRWIDDSWLDLRLGARMLVKYPGLTLVGSLGMAVAIAIGATFFTLTYSYLQPGLPLDEGDRIVAIENWDAEANSDERRSLHDFVTWREELRSIRDVGAFRTVTRNLIAEGGPAEPVGVAEITAAGFRVPRIPPLLGRPIVEDDERDRSPHVVVIGYELWRTRFGSDASIVGRDIRLGTTVHTVIGVMPERFAFPVNHRIWVPMRLNPADYARRQGPSIAIFGRLAPGATRGDAEAELAAIGRRAADAFPQTHARLRPRIVRFTTMYAAFSRSDVARWQLHGFQSLVSMLLVVVCANVALLIYARTATRMGELAVRTALGASRRRIIGQLFLEALVLSAVAAVAGLALASFAMIEIDGILKTLGPLPFWITPGLSGSAVIYVLAMTVMAAVIAGVAPALQATGLRLHSDLRQLGGSTGMRLGKTWTALIVVQVAFAVAVLPAVVFQASELIPYAVVDPGFNASQYLTARLTMERDAPPSATAESYERDFMTRYVDRQTELIRRLESEPGVSAVTFAWTNPGEERTVWIEIEGVRMPEDFRSQFAVRSGSGGFEVRFGRVDLDYFSAFDVPLVAGRPFTAADLAEDGPGRPPSMRINRTVTDRLLYGGGLAPAEPGHGTSVIVNRSFVAQLLHGVQPIGRRLRYVGRSGDASPEDVDMGRWYEIAGVVSDFPPKPMEPDLVAPRVYHALAPGAMHPVTLLIRARAPDAAPLAGRVREIATDLDPTLRVDRILALDDVLREEQGMIRVGALALGLTTLSVLLLSAAGIYALMAFTIAQRRKEIGIRTALGANSRRILAGIFSRALLQLGLGVVTGVAVAALLDRLAEGDLMGGQTAIVLPAVSALMVIVGLLAALGPARRGLRIQPTEALREH